MPRTLDPAAQELIDGGHVDDHTAVVITLGTGTVLRFATAGFIYGGNTWLGVLEETGTFKMNNDVQAVDRAMLKVTNVDLAFGQEVTSASEALEGATAMLGYAFRAQDGSGPWYYDEKMPGDIVAGAVDENIVELSFIGDIYAGQIVGEIVSEVFPYQQESGARLRPSDPNDLPVPDDIPRGPGRFPDTREPGFSPRMEP